MGVAEAAHLTLGVLGEKLAADYLEKNGYTIVDKNVRMSKNEIDIIAEDDSFLVFVEVKTRSVQHEGSSLYGSPARAVDSKKRSNTVKAAIDYLRINYTEKQPRIDVIEVYMKERNNENSIHPQILSINHIRDAFDSRGRKH